MKQKKRLAYIDIAKGISIISIIMLHIDYAFCDHPLLPLWSLLGNSWGVCVFFLLGGFFVTNERLLNPRKFIGDKLRALYIPLIIFYIVVLLLHNTFIDIGFHQVGLEEGGKLITRYEVVDLLQHIAEALLLAGREPLLAPLWFLSVMILAMLGFCLLTYVLYKLLERHSLPPELAMRRMEQIRIVIVLVACIIGHVFSNYLDLNIPRFNNTFTALWLMLCGYLIYQKRHCLFDNGKIAFACVVIVYVSTIVFGPNIIISNRYDNVVSLTLCTTAALYAICYVSRKIEKMVIGKVLAWAGRHSMAAMALHLIAFKVATIFMRLTFIPDIPQYTLNPQAGNSLGLLIYYTVVGVVLPAALASIFLWLRRQFASFRGRHDCYHKQPDDNQNVEVPTPENVSSSQHHSS